MPRAGRVSRARLRTPGRRAGLLVSAGRSAGAPGLYGDRCRRRRLRPGRGPARHLRLDGAAPRCLSLMASRPCRRRSRDGGGAVRAYRATVAGGADHGGAGGTPAAGGIRLAGGSARRGAVDRGRRAQCDRWPAVVLGRRGHGTGHVPRCTAWPHSLRLRLRAAWRADRRAGGVAPVGLGSGAVSERPGPRAAHRRGGWRSGLR